MPDSLSQRKDEIFNLFEWLIDPLINFIHSKCKMVTTGIVDNGLIQGLINIFESLLDEFRNDEHQRLKPEDVSLWLQSLFMFSCVWSLGSAVDADSRPIFNEYIKNLVTESNKFPVLVQFPSDQSVYDYAFDKSKSVWVHWMTTSTPLNIPIDADIQFHEMFVPTIESVRTTYLLELLIAHGKHVLFTGPTGTGKSASIRNVLLNKLDKDKYMPIVINFSYQTRANQTQDTIDSKVKFN